MGQNVNLPMVNMSSLARSLKMINTSLKNANNSLPRDSAHMETDASSSMTMVNLATTSAITMCSK